MLYECLNYQGYLRIISFLLVSLGVLETSFCLKDTVLKTS